LTATIGPYAVSTVPDTIESLKATVDLLRKQIRRYSRKPEIREAAHEITANVPSQDSTAEIAAVHEWIRSNISFRADPAGAELIECPLKVIAKVRQGLPVGLDCDDFTLLAGSLLEALGHECRLKMIGTTPGRYEHVSLVVNDDQAGRWIDFDLAIPNAPLGATYDKPKSRWIESVDGRLAGPPAAGELHVDLAGAHPSRLGLQPESYPRGYQLTIGPDVWIRDGSESGDGARYWRKGAGFGQIRAGAGVAELPQLEQLEQPEAESEPVQAAPSEIEPVDPLDVAPGAGLRVAEPEGETWIDIAPGAEDEGETWIDIGDDSADLEAGEETWIDLADAVSAENIPLAVPDKAIDAIMAESTDYSGPGTVNVISAIAAADIAMLRNLSTADLDRIAFGGDDSSQPAALAGIKKGWRKFWRAISTPLRKLAGGKVGKLIRRVIFKVTDMFGDRLGPMVRRILVGRLQLALIFSGNGWATILVRILVEDIQDWRDLVANIVDDFLALSDEQQEDAIEDAASRADIEIDRDSKLGEAIALLETEKDRAEAEIRRIRKNLDEQLDEARAQMEQKLVRAGDRAREMIEDGELFQGEAWEQMQDYRAGLEQEFSELKKKGEDLYSDQLAELEQIVADGQKWIEKKRWQAVAYQRWHLDSIDLDMRLRLEEFENDLQASVSAGLVSFDEAANRIRKREQEIRREMRRQTEIAEKQIEGVVKAAEEFKAEVAKKWKAEADRIFAYAQTFLNSQGARAQEAIEAYVSEMGTNGLKTLSRGLAADGIDLVKLLDAKGVDYNAVLETMREADIARGLDLDLTVASISLGEDADLELMRIFRDRGETQRAEKLQRSLERRGVWSTSANEQIGSEVSDKIMQAVLPDGINLDLADRVYGASSRGLKTTRDGRPIQAARKVIQKKQIEQAAVTVAGVGVAGVALSLLSRRF